MTVPLRRRDETPPNIVTYDRDVFVNDVFDYKPGEHLTIVGPTQRGKTYLGFQLLERTANPQQRGIVLASKPRDATVDALLANKRWRLVEEWDIEDVPLDEEWSWQKKKRDGYVLRPHQSLRDISQDDANVHKHFKQAIIESYGSRDTRILFIDEAHQVSNDLKLRKEIEAVLKRGSALHTGVWCLIQRAKYLPYDMYNAPEHIFLFNDPDKTNRERFGEIGGGVDPRIVENVTNHLDQYQVLYIKRTSDDPTMPGPLLCIVNK